MRKAGPAYKAGSSMRGAEERADELGDTVVIVRDETRRPCYCYFSAAVMRHPGQRQDRKGGSQAYKPRYQPTAERSKDRNWRQEAWRNAAWLHAGLLSGLHS